VTITVSRDPEEENMRSFMSFLAAGAAAFVLHLSAVSAEGPAPYSGIVVFGTSLSDPGNAFALRGGTSNPPDYFADPMLIPSAPYARGGHHFSNGATWVEQLARSIGLAGSVRPAYASESLKATNYAVAAARAYEDGQNVNLSKQVQTFLADHGGVAPSDALYVVEMGGNDIRDAIVAYQTGGPSAAQGILQQAISSIAQNIQILYAAGAREFLVWLPPNPGLTPALRNIPPAVQLATALTQAFNTFLSGTLAQLSQLPGITIRTLDASLLLNTIANDPSAYGLTNTTEACITPDVAPFFCQQPDEYLFWDGIHPTRAAHAIVAALAASILGL
jgi:outer membrane lipase/esterase